MRSARVEHTRAANAAELPGGGRGHWRTRTSWTAADDAKLCELVDAGLGHDAIAKALGKTSGAIRNRVHRLGLGGSVSP